MATEGNNNIFFPIILLLPLIYLILKHYFKPSIPSLPPGPFQWPILGNILQVGNKPHLSLTHFSKTYGPLFSMKLGTQLVVVGSSPTAAIEILKKHDRVLSGRYVPHVAPTKSPELNKLSLGWIVECNDKWKYLRSLCKSELFSSKAMEFQAVKREEKVVEMVGFIEKLEGKELKLKEIGMVTVFNMLSCILVSRNLMSYEDLENGDMKWLLSRILEVASTPNLSDLYPVLGRFDLQGLQKKIKELHERCFQIFEGIVEERRVCKGKDRDFLDTLITNGSSNDQINVLLMELLSAGTDTSSNTIEWTMAELIKNPKCLKKLEEEIATQVVSQNILKESHIPNLKYLQACVKETLRLHPPGPFLLPHRAVENCQVMNYTIPKDTQVLVNFWAIGRDPKYWQDPLVFDPERFLNSNLDFKGNDFEFIPFGSGRRICPGLPMAAKQVALIVAYLIHFFQWSLPNGYDINMTEKYGLTLTMDQPLLLIPKLKQGMRN
ncbi:(S)-N-methylcoclaurine 3'-hydroxylase isozyme 1-like [Euphorbia lathyris]|uniref:(S)-N-methylcoclaurine 3'-hydroxylase isozyme 1-like n=1 Tax=Euphorbia lathyris TaxID=212925 RepID=UPI003313D1DD